MLETIGVLSQTEKDQILSGLNTVLAEIENGDMRRVDLEDVHMNIEHRLIELIGDTVRSSIRDDLATIVATDSALLRTAIDQLVVQQRTLAHWHLAESNADTVMPGFTHLQAAQPITLGTILWLGSRCSTTASVC